MNAKTRFGKTVSLAATNIVAGGVFLMGGGDFVHGQPGVTHQVIPQIVVGSYDGGVTKCSTIIQLINTGPGTATISGQFFTEAGDASSTPYITLANNISRSFNTGTLDATTLTPNTMLLITGESVAPGVTNWARITSSGGTVAINAVFEQRYANSVLIYRIGVAATSDNIKKFVIPRMSNPSTALDVGFAFVNTGAATTMIAAELRDANGTLIKTKSLSLAGQHHIATFAGQFFEIVETGTQTTQSFIIFEATSAQIAVLALAYEGASVTSFPVEVLQ